MLRLNQKLLRTNPKRRLRASRLPQEGSLLDPRTLTPWHTDRSKPTPPDTRQMSACEHAFPSTTISHVSLSSPAAFRSDDGQKVAIQMLLNSLESATSSLNAIAASNGTPPLSQQFQGAQPNFHEPGLPSRPIIPPQNDLDEELPDSPHIDLPSVPDSSSPSQDCRSSSTEARLHQALKQKNAKRAMVIFNDALRTNEELRLSQIVSLFFLVADSEPFDAYTVFKEFHRHPQCRGSHNGMYRKMCKAVSLIDPKMHFRRDSIAFVESLLRDVEELDLDMKSSLYPVLVTSLTSQQSVTIGDYARPIYQKIQQLDIQVSPGWLINLLSLSKFRRQDILPFHHILAQIVERNAKIDPPIVLRAIHNLFPFSDAPICESMLQSLLQLIKQDVAVSHQSTSRFCVDMGTIDSMSAVSARTGNSRIIFLLWDIVDILGYAPTASLYENTIITFAMCGKTSRAFNALKTMEGDEFPANRALIRNFSRILRSKPGRLNRVSYMFLKSARMDDSPISLGAFNSILSAFAGTGRVDEATKFFEQVTALGLEPDVDSYSFAIESLGKDLLRRKAEASKEQVEELLDCADLILDRMEGNNVMPSPDVIRNYVELLCLAGEVATATAVVKDALASDRPHAVNNKTIYRIAIENANEGEFEIAREMASQTSESIRTLHRNIEVKQSRQQDETENESSERSS